MSSLNFVVIQPSVTVYFRFRQIQNGCSVAILENSNGDISLRGGSSDLLRVWFQDGIFGVGESNGAISGLNKFKRYVGENNARGVN